jgi:hypothetical protein
MAEKLLPALSWKNCTGSNPQEHLSAKWQQRQWIALSWRFLTDKQVWITEELNVGYSPAKKEGTKLEVRYDPEDPSNVLTDSKLELEVLPRLLVGIGVFGLILLLLKLLEITQFLS